MPQIAKRCEAMPGHGVRISGGCTVTIPPTAKRMPVLVPTDKPDLVPLLRAERNALCPCGSQKKFKKCCYLTDGVPQPTDETQS